MEFSNYRHRRVSETEVMVIWKVKVLKVEVSKTGGGGLEHQAVDLNVEVSEAGRSRETDGRLEVGVLESWRSTASCACLSLLSFLKIFNLSELFT